MTEEIIRTEFDLACGDRYRQEPKGDSSPTMPKWLEFEKQRRAERRKAKLKESKVTKEEPKQSADKMSDASDLLQGSYRSSCSELLCKPADKA